MVYEKNTNQERRDYFEQHSVKCSSYGEVLIEPGGGSELIKVRLQGTKEDMDWLEKQLKGCNQIKIAESSEI